MLQSLDHRRMLILTEITTSQVLGKMIAVAQITDNIWGLHVFNKTIVELLFMNVGEVRLEILR